MSCEQAPLLVDISPPLSAATAVFPGDAPFAARQTFTIGPGCPVNVAAISLSVHAGAHADAPLHYDPGGAAIDALDLAAYLGPARVVDATAGGPLLTLEDLPAGVLDAAPPRLLLRLHAGYDHDHWRDDFRALDPALVDGLAARGVRLVGVDGPSVDPASSHTLPAHQRFRAHDMRILENLVLAPVAAGDWELIALPLRLSGLDASPVRAVLRRLATPAAAG